MLGGHGALCSARAAGSITVLDRTLLRARQMAYACLARALLCMKRPSGPRTLYEEACAAGMWTSATCRSRGFRACQWP
eukprot:4280064-Prymnesium_polylepis.1